jgi:flagellar biosynthesis/type III secretory pathway M-ring protein FliF/YscJ
VNLLLAIVILLVVLAVVQVVSAPLRRRLAAPPAGGEREGGHRAAEVSEPARGDLEAAREAKYREIRDAELDFRTGKLSAEDYDALDAQLRREAIEILDRIERLRDA